MTTNPDWDLAGLTRESGTLDLPFPDYGWLRSFHVWLDGERLTWTHDWTQPDGSLILQRHGTGLLDGFVQLADAPPDKILAYARKWGTLGICAHGLPATHSLSRDYVSFQHPDVAKTAADPRSAFSDDGACRPRHVVEPWSLAKWEPVSAWRNYSRRARALLNLIAVAERGLPPSMDDIQTAYPTFRLGEWELHGTRGISLAQSVTGTCLSDWLDISGVGLGLVWWEKSKLTLKLMGGGLFGAIAISLAMKAVRSEGLAICSECGTGYSPSRAPRSGQRSYCPNCRAAGVPQRDATRAMRVRQRGSKS